jgi:hypothetical protein
MAFIRFDIAPAAGSTVDGDMATGLALFSTLERIVIGASAGDGLSTLGEPGRWRQHLHRLFDIRRKTRLANPRLEALRRLAVLLRHRRAVDAHEIDRFTAAGFTTTHYQALEAATRPARRGDSALVVD